MDNIQERNKRNWKWGLRIYMLVICGAGLCLALFFCGKARVQSNRSADTAKPVSGNVQEENGTGENTTEIVEEEKRIALTFDDGPHPVYTDQLLDGLAEREVKVTFFLLGTNIEGREEVVKRIAKEGHLIGNHTFDHVDITRLPQEEACAQIRKTSDLITGITGQEVEYIRPPFGNWAKELECEVMMLPIFWSLDTLDWSTKNTRRIVEKVVTSVEENDIILMHDSYESTVEATMQIIDLLKAEGYEFVTADQLILE